MDQQHRHASESVAAIRRHPIHPMLVPFPIAFLVGTLVTDIVYHSSNSAFWADASYWLLIAGILTALLSAVPGLIDYLGIKRARQLPSAHVHALGNVTAVALVSINPWLRWRDLVAGAGGWDLLLSVLTVALLGVTGWLGGELSYRHRIGMIAGEDRGAADGIEVLPTASRATIRGRGVAEVPL